MSNNKKWYKQWWAITFFIFLGLIILLIALSGFYFLKKVKNNQAGHNNFQGDITAQMVEQLKSQEKYSHPQGSKDSAHYLGTTSPEVTIVEFADFNCPYSRQAHSHIRRIGIEHGENVKIVFRHFPSQEKAVNLSMAAECAGEQDLFWPMHDKLFALQEEITPNKNSQLIQLAQQIGADTSRFERCLEEEKYLARIKKDAQDGARMDVRGTPTYFINGHKISGNVPYSMLIAIINGLMASSTTNN